VILYSRYMKVDKQTSAKPVLHHREEFERLLTDYHISDQAASTLANTTFVLMVAATASGRNTIIKHLTDTGKYYYVVSDTTRPMRLKDGKVVEHNGVEYFFRKEDEVLQDVREGKFIEAAIIHEQQVSGISIREIENAQESGKIAITDIEVQGCETIAQLKPDIIPIFVLPPNFEEWLRRIHKRSELTNEEVKSRLEAAVREYGIALEDDRFIFIVNDNLEDAVQAVDEVARLGHRDPAAEAQFRELAKSLRDQAQDYLAQYPNW